MNLFEFIEKHPAMTIFIVIMLYYAILNICQTIVYSKQK